MKNCYKMGINRQGTAYYQVFNPLPRTKHVTPIYALL